MHRVRGRNLPHLSGAPRKLNRSMSFLSAPFGVKMSSQVRRALLQIAPKARWTDRARRAASILKSFTITFNPEGGVTAGLDVEALSGVGDSGAIAEDLTDLFVALGEAAQEERTGVIFLLDEIQYLSTAELEALISALHKCARRSLPITLVGAGLPQIPRLAGEAKSYSERLFTFPKIGRLEPLTDARDALILPSRPNQIEIDRQRTPLHSGTRLCRLYSSSIRQVYVEEARRSCG